MNRRTAVLLGSLVAALAAAELIVLSGLLAAERRHDRDRYVEAMSRQRRAAGRSDQPGAPPSPLRQPSTFCVRGVDTLVVTARAGLQREVVSQRRLDVAALRELSDLAIRAERYLEQASAGPALPQRMGRERRPAPGAAPGAAIAAATDAAKTAASPNKAGAAAAPTWQALAPARIDCEDGDAYASFRLDVDKPPVRPASTPPAKKSARRGKPTRKSQKTRPPGR